MIVDLVELSGSNRLHDLLLPVRTAGIDDHSSCRTVKEPLHVQLTQEVREFRRVPGQHEYLRVDRGVCRLLQSVVDELQVLCR